MTTLTDNMPVTKFSPQQTAFINFAEHDHRSANLIAVAGAGKTTTLLEAARVIPGQSAICAYNKKIAEEITAKLKSAGIDWKKAKAGTVHSFGFNALKKAFDIDKDDVDEFKVIDIINGLIGENEEVQPYATLIAKLVSLAKQRAIGITTKIDDRSAYASIIDHFDLLEEADEYTVSILIDYAIPALKKNNTITDKIDFDDMVYLPVLLRCKFWQYDNVFVDEAQDTNEARRLLVKAMVKRRGRVFAIGDPHQAIYGFTGADSDSLAAIGRDFNAVTLPLTVSYRCPKAVVAFARQWVSHIEAHPDAPEGSVSNSTFEDMLKNKQMLNSTSAILCRNTRPLVSTAFALIREKVACRIEGRAIGTNLIKMIQRWKRIKGLHALRDRLDQYFAAQAPKLKEARKEAKLQELEDQIETIKVIIDHCLSQDKDTVADAVAYINELFADNVSGMLTLSTIHKSKGREFDRVYWLDREGTCPSKYARLPWMQAQEKNLCYVAATRAKQELIDLSPPKKKQD